MQAAPATSTDLNGRLAVVTGSANGIGRATAEAFAAAGYHVAAWDLDDQAGAALVAAITAGGGSAEHAHVDVSDSASVEAAVARLIDERGRVDALINNAGILRDAQLVKIKHGELVGKRVGALSAAQLQAQIDALLAKE